MKLTNAMAWTAAAVVILGAGGCDKNKTDQKADNDIFKEDGKERVSSFIDVQAGNGARYDAMLYPQHFSGSQLNSLGRAKVLLMLEDCDSCEPITVHLVNCGKDELYAKRQAAVEMYLKTVEGHNASTLHPAAPELARVPKTESGETTVETTMTDQVPATTGGPPLVK